MTTMLPDQCRGARGLLRWTQPRLADESGIGLSTLNRYEMESRPPKEQVVKRLQAALEQAGIEFISENAKGGVGVRLKKSFDGS
ncbi:MAG: helix-turn-helix transcriptional regulator [Rhodospirillaceae bacterium]|jgi:transcriptional regulator with XRE-family HTH domain|nr:helix-turn-helix transcriptional regulator [Rhodospirillaceae bacterium]